MGSGQNQSSRTCQDGLLRKGASAQIKAEESVALRKKIPCKKCGTAKLSKTEDYIVGSLPARLMNRGGIFTWKCVSCGTIGKMTRPEFQAIPNEKEIDAKGEELGRD